MATISTAYKGDMLFQTQLGNHSVLVDVPAPMGGKDRALTPPELFIISLSSCVGALVAEYCEKHDIDDTDMTVDVSFEKVSKPTRLTNIKVHVNLPHADCMDREAAIRRVAAHCPVHETLEQHDPIEFEITAQACEPTPA